MVVEVDGVVDHRQRGGAAQHQVLAVRRVERDQPGAGMLQQGELELRVDHVVGRGFEGEGGQVAARQLLVQPIEAEAGDRRRVDQHLAQHDEEDSQSQHPGREATAEAGQSCPFGCAFALGQTPGQTLR